MQAHTDAAHGPAAETRVFAYFAEFSVEWGGIREIMELVNGDQLEEAMDVMAQRILSIQKAKSQGGSWEKARNLLSRGVNGFTMENL